VVNYLEEYEVFESRITRYLEENKKIIDMSIERFLEEKLEAGIIGVSTYIVEGGKRLRGLLVLLTSDSLGGDRKTSLNSAVAVELVHASSLSIDDIIDLDKQRRGKPSTWVAYGVSKTVLVSNILIPYAQLLVEPLGKRAVHEVIETWLKITKGEILDVFYGDSIYEDVVKLKTSSLFQLSLVLGALSAGREDLIPHLKEYGKYLGMAYQVADDIVDFINIEKKGEREAESLKKFLKWIGIENMREDGDRQLAVKLGIQRLESLLKKAIDTGKNVPEDELRSVLLLLPKYMVSRMLSEGKINFSYLE